MNILLMNEVTEFKAIKTKYQSAHRIHTVDGFTAISQHYRCYSYEKAKYDKLTIYCKFVFQNSSGDGTIPIPNFSTFSRGQWRSMYGCPLPLPLRNFKKIGPFFRNAIKQKLKQASPLHCCIGGSRQGSFLLVEMF